MIAPSTIITIGEAVLPLAVQVIDLWRSRPRAVLVQAEAQSELDQQLEDAMRRLLAPVIDDGLQLADLFAIQQPAMELWTATQGLLDLPDHPSDLAALGLPLDHPTKWRVVTRNYDRLLSHWDPEVDFSFNWWLKPIEGTAEEATDALIVQAAREVAPLVLEQGLLSARAKWPHLFRRQAA